MLSSVLMTPSDLTERDVGRKGLIPAEWELGACEKRWHGGVFLNPPLRYKAEIESESGL